MTQNPSNKQENLKNDSMQDNGRKMFEQGEEGFNPDQPLRSKHGENRLLGDDDVQEQSPEVDGDKETTPEIEPPNPTPYERQEPKF